MPFPPLFYLPFSLSLSLSLSHLRLDGLIGEMSGVYLQPPSFQVLLEEGDFALNSLARCMSVLDRLTTTHPVWLLLSLSDQEVTRILLQQPPGVREREREREKRERGSETSPAVCQAAGF